MRHSIHRQEDHQSLRSVCQPKDINFSVNIFRGFVSLIKEK